MYSRGCGILLSLYITYFYFLNTSVHSIELDSWLSQISDDIPQQHLEHDNNLKDYETKFVGLNIAFNEISFALLKFVLLFLKYGVCIFKPIRL